MLTDSGMRVPAGSCPGSDVETRVSTISGCLDRVRPPLKMKGRTRFLLRLRKLIAAATSFLPASLGGPRSSVLNDFAQLRAQLRSEHVSDVLHELGHLETDDLQLGPGGGEHRHAGAVADRHDEQVPVVEADQQLLALTPLEESGTAHRQAVQPTGDGGELFGVFLGKVAGVCQDQPVGGDHDGVLHTAYVPDEPIDDPGEVLNAVVFGFSHRVFYLSSAECRSRWGSGVCSHTWNASADLVLTRRLLRVPRRRGRHAPRPGSRPARRGSARPGPPR